MWSWQKSQLEYREGKFRSMIIFLKKTPSTLLSQKKNSDELQSFMKNSLSSQELSLAETKVKELAVLRQLNG